MVFSGSFLPGVFSYNKSREQNAHCQTVEKPDKIGLFLVRITLVLFSESISASLAAVCLKLKLRVALSLKTVHRTVFTSLRSAQSPSSPVACFIPKKKDP